MLNVKDTHMNIQVALEIEKILCCHIRGCSHIKSSRTGGEGGKGDMMKDDGDMWQKGGRGRKR